MFVARMTESSSKMICHDFALRGYGLLHSLLGTCVVWVAVSFLTGSATLLTHVTILILK